MSNQAVELFVARAPKEEGLKLKPYDDATGKPVVAPVGNLSWGIGFNLMVCGSPELFEVILRHLAGILDAQLSALPWYLNSPPGPQSAFLDVAYNEGESHLVHGFPLMTMYAGLKNWTACAAQCKVLDASLDKSRYAPLRVIIAQG